jgi:hypothetical protein
MTWSLVQKSAAPTFGGGSTVDPPLPGASAAGNLLVACIVDADEASTVTGPSGWQMAVQGTQAFAGSTGIWYYPDNPGGISNASFADTSGDLGDAWLAEFTISGVSAVTPDSSGTGSTGSATSCAATATGSSAAGDLAIAVFSESVFASVTWGTPSGWTPIGSDTGPAIAMCACLLSAPAGALSVTGATTGGPSGQWAAAVATFSVGGGGLTVNAGSFMSFFA